MRTSDAERQRVADFLRDACAEGRLSADELEQRLDRLFAGGTVADVERLVWDLPGGEAVVPRFGGGARPSAAVRRRRGAPGRPAGTVALVGVGLGVAALVALPPLLQLISVAIILSVVVAVGVLAAALAPAALVLFALVWLSNRAWRGRAGGPPPWGPRGRSGPPPWGSSRGPRQFS